MGTQIPGVDAFPADFTVPAIGDTENAAAFGVALEALADRTQSLHQSRTALADLAALRAINTTGMANGTVRFVKRQGLFVLDTAAFDVEIEPWVIDPTTGPGRWFGCVPHTTSRVVLVQGTVIKGVTSAVVNVGSRAVDVDFIPITVTHISTFSDGNAQIAEVNTGSAASKGYLYPITEHMIDGATLASVRCRFKPNPTHPNLPAVMPSFGVRRVERTLGSAPSALKSTSSGFADDPSPTVGAYNPEHEWTWVADQNKVIDLSQYTYDIVAFYEGHTNALTGGGLVSFELTFTGKIPARALPGTAPPAIDPEGIAWSGWWRSVLSGEYDGAPWTPSASAGASGSNGNLTAPVAAPTVGTLQNGYTPAAHDGATQWLRSAPDISALVTASAGTVSVLVKTPPTSAAAAGAVLDDPSIISLDGSGFIGIGWNSSGIRFYAYDGAYKSITIACSANAYHLLQMKWDGTTLFARVDGGSWQTLAVGALAGIAGAIQTGTNYARAQWAAIELLELAVSGSVLTNGALDDYRDAIAARYAVSI